MPASRHEKTEIFLAGSPLLSSLPATEIEDLAKHAQYHSFEVDDAIFVQGTAGSHIYWVVKGRVRLTATSITGTDLLHSMIEPGDYFGEITAVDGGMRGVNALAEMKTEALALDRRYLMPVFKRNPEAVMVLARLLCRQVRIAGSTIESLAFHNAETRIWTRLMYLSQQYSTPDAKNRAIRIDHGLSQQHLADSVGLTRVMVNRQLGLWRDAGLIEDGRGFVVVFDPTKLEKHVWRGSHFGESSDSAAL